LKGAWPRRWRGTPGGATRACPATTEELCVGRCHLMGVLRTEADLDKGRALARFGAAPRAERQTE
jgi:hypothetical protein